MGSMKGRGKDAAEVPLGEMSQLFKTIELHLNMREKKKDLNVLPWEAQEKAK